MVLFLASFPSFPSAGFDPASVVSDLAGFCWPKSDGLQPRVFEAFLGVWGLVGGVNG